MPCEKVFEDEYVLAFLNIRPEKPGHTLVIPKVHVRNIFDCPHDVLCNVMNGVQEVARILMDDGATAVRIVQNNEKPLQEVFHLHFHVSPH